MLSWHVFRSTGNPVQRGRYHSAACAAPSPLQSASRSPFGTPKSKPPVERRPAKWHKLTNQTQHQDPRDPRKTSRGERDSTEAPRKEGEGHEGPKNRCAKFSQSHWDLGLGLAHNIFNHGQQPRGLPFDMDGEVRSPKPPREGVPQETCLG